MKVARDIGLLPPLSLTEKLKALSPSSPTIVGNRDVITGVQLAKLSTGERIDFIAAVKRAIIFAKLSPYQKLEVVEALREGKETVGMIGDGVNDSLALKGADVGISVDTGMEIAKEAADIILLEKSLVTIVEGVRLGRMTALNTVKYIKLTASSNVSSHFSPLVSIKLNLSFLDIILSFSTVWQRLQYFGCIGVVALSAYVTHSNSRSKYALRFLLHGYSLG